MLLVAPTFGAYGGMEAFVLNLADTLRGDARFDVRVCFKGTGNFARQPALAEACARRPVEFCARASAQLWRAIAWADVVHGQNASPDVAAMTALLRRPLVLTIHNVLPATPSVRRFTWRAAAATAKRRWFNSRYVWQTWERAPRSGSAQVSPAARLAGQRIPPQQRRGFVFAGRLVEGKGVALLVDAYRRAGLDPVRWPLTIVGDGPMREARTCPGVAFAGFLADDAKAATITGARWLVVPSHWQEPYGMVAVEARSLGVPVIATADGGLPEAAGRDALICPPGDVEALAATLRRAAAMPDDEYAARARRTAEDLDAELPPPGFYAQAYIELVARP